MAKLSNRNIILIGLLVLLFAAAVFLIVRNRNIEPVVVATPIPDATPDASAFVPYTNAENGITLDMPSDWVARTTIPGVTVASSERALGIESFTELQTDGVMVIIPGELDTLEFQTGDAFPGPDPEALLNLYIDLLRKEGQEYLGVLPTERFTVDDQEGAKTIVQSRDGDVTLEIIMATIVNEENGYLAFISTAANRESAAALRATFAAIIQTVHVAPPITAQ